MLSDFCLTEPWCSHFTQGKIPESFLTLSVSILTYFSLFELNSQFHLERYDRNCWERCLAYHNGKP